MSSRIRSFVALVTLALATPLALVVDTAPAVAAPSVAAGFGDVLVASGLGAATSFTELPDDRLLITTKDGKLWVLGADGTKPADPALTLAPCTASEQGLLGVTTDPAVATNGHIYLFYTKNTGSGCTNRVSRFTLGGATVSPASELVLLDGIDSGAGNHNGGDVQLGKDGLLYISVGDNAVSSNAQNTNTRHGKILRIGRDGSIPADNPFANTPGAASCTTSEPGNAPCKEIIAWGLRNPFRIAPDVNATGTVFNINDVGDATAEEIDTLALGANYGWDVREGFCPRGSRSGCEPQPPQFTPPIFDYTRQDNCRSITGGAFSPAGAFPGRYNGAYFYGDFVCEKIFALVPNGAGGYTNEQFVGGAGPVVHLRTMRRANVWGLYYLTLGGELHVVTSDTPAGSTGPSSFHPLAPTRVLDTRVGTGFSGRKPAAGDTVSVKVAGTGGVPADAVAVALNLTGTEATAAGYVTAWPTGETRPLTSVLNLAGPADTSANAVIARIGAGGQVNLFTQAGTHLVADVTGYWTEAPSSKDGRYTPAPAPTRLLDTRAANGVASTTIVPAGATVDLQVTGRGGVPATGVSAVALVVTVTNTATSGFVTAWPSGTTRPLASTVNPVGANDIRSNLVLLPIGTNGKVSLYTLQATHLVVDLAGWFSDDSADTSTTGLLVALSPQRVVATPDRNPFGRLSGGTPVSQDYSSVVGTGAIAIVHNLTIDGSADAGYLTAWPAGSTAPTASNVNWSGPRQTRAALAISSLASAGRVSYGSNVATELFIDRFGYFTA
jgi:glucose/arabinose dehydrogenase